MHPSGEIVLTPMMAGMLAGMDHDSIAEALYTDHRDRVFHLCLRLCGGNAAWAEDATQDVFVKLLQKLDGLDETEDLGGWIYRVTMNTCMTRLKREGTVWGRVMQVLSGATANASRDTPERRVSVRQDLGEALQVLRGLPAKQRVVFSMRYLDEQPQKEIADALDLSEGYVSKLLQRTRDQLQRMGWEAPRD